MSQKVEIEKERLRAEIMRMIHVFIQNTGFSPVVSVETRRSTGAARGFQYDIDISEHLIEKKEERAAEPGNVDMNQTVSYLFDVAAAIQNESDNRMIRNITCYEALTLAVQLLK